ncbi:MAG: hypothetical protein QM690_12100 [Sphingobium sp.]
MSRQWKLALSSLLVLGSALSACYDDRPGRHRPPRHDHDRPGRPGDGWGDGRPGDSRPGRPGNDWGDRNRPR